MSSCDVGCNSMLAIIYKLIYGTVVNSRKTNKTKSVQLNFSVFSPLFIFCLIFFSCGKDMKAKNKVSVSGWVVYRIYF